LFWTLFVCHSLTCFIHIKCFIIWSSVEHCKGIFLDLRDFGFCLPFLFLPIVSKVRLHCQ
jgi:hypothetical protein